MNNYDLYIITREENEVCASFLTTIPASIFAQKIPSTKNFELWILFSFVCFMDVKKTKFLMFWMSELSNVSWMLEQRYLFSKFNLWLQFSLNWEKQQSFNVSMDIEITFSVMNRYVSFECFWLLRVIKVSFFKT